ncbi:toxin Cry1Ac domain D-VI-related protein [Heyndrickxia sporothermodurans]|nr:toxin Cry1Ac domain D-VI-related protein [Heyndrickxia sporothermodurans]
MNKKLVVAGLLTVGLISSGVAIFSYNNHVHAVEAKKIETLQKETVNRIQEKVNKLYKDDQKSFLSDNLSQEKFDNIQKELDRQKGKEFQVKYAAKLNTAIMDFGYASNMFTLQNTVNSLFDNKGAIAGNVNFDLIDKKVEELKDIKPLFVTQQQKLISNGKGQLMKIKKAKDKINQLFLDSDHNQIKSKVNREDYNESKKLVQEIKSERIRKNLSKLLYKIDQQLKAKEEVVKSAENDQEKQTKVKLDSDVNSFPSESQTRQKATSNKIAPSSSGTETKSTNKKSPTSNVKSSYSQKSSPSEKPKSNGSQKGSKMKPGDSWEIKNEKNTGKVDGHDTSQFDW